MKLTFVLCLFLALWCALSWAKDHKGSAIFKDLSQVPFTTYLIDPGSFQKKSLEHGRHIGSGLNWNLGRMSLKDFIFPKRNADKEDKDAQADFEVDSVEDIDTEEEDSHPHFHHYPFYPFSPYFNTGFPFAGYPYTYYPYPYDPYAAFENPGYQFAGFPYPVSNSGKNFPVIRKWRKYRN